MGALTPEQIKSIFKQCRTPEAEEFINLVIAHCPNCVSRFDEEEVPMFRQGAPNHELEGYVDAEFCTWAVAEIERLRGLIVEKAERSNSPDTELLDKLNKLAVV